MRSTLSSYKLRDYQKSLIQGVYERWKSGDRSVMAQLPTGGGKTAIFSEIAREMAQEGVLVIAHRQELITQAAEKLQSICGEPVGIIKAGVKPSPVFRIQVASIQTLVRRNFPPAGLVIIDESHHATARGCRKILNAYPKAYVLGVTATPVRTDGSGFDDLFDALVCGPSVKQLIASGYLAPFRLYADSKPIDTSGVRTVAGDYNQKQLADTVDIVKLSGDLIESYRRHANGKRNLVFAINVEHSKCIADRYNAAGIPAEHVDGETPDVERKAIFERFALGVTKVLSNVGIATEGTDIPAIECVQVARPTKSLGLHLQMLGRALRPVQGKEYAIFIDHTKNWAIHGLPTRDRIWTLEGVKEDESTRTVKKENGEVVEEPIPQEVEILESEVSLTEIDEAAAEIQFEISELDKLISIAQSRNYKKGWVVYRFLELKPSLEALKDCAKKLGYHHAWADHKYEEMQNEADLDDSE